MPTLAIGVVGLWVRNINLWELHFDAHRGGYWFTITAFELFVAYAAVAYTLEKLRASSTVKILTWLTLAGATSAIYYMACSSKIDLTSTWTLALGAEMFTLHMRYFIFGILAKMFFDRFIHLVENQWITLASLAAFVVLYRMSGHVQMTLRALSGIVLLFAFFHYFRQKLNSTTRIGRFLLLIGKNTLPIYLMHYIFLHGLRNLRGTPLVELICQNFVLAIILCLTLAIVIALLCIATDRALKFLPPIHALVHGFDIIKNSTPKK